MSEIFRKFIKYFFILKCYRRSCEISLKAARQRSLFILSTWRGSFVLQIPRLSCNPSSLYLSEKMQLSPEKTLKKWQVSKSDNGLEG